jgi:hypothetical protein
MNSRGHVVDHCEPAELASALMGGGFFPPEAVLCEWNVETYKSSEVTDLALFALAAHEEANCAVFVPRRSSITKWPIWHAVVANALLIEEPIVTSENLPDILRYVQNETNLDTPADFLSQQRVLDAFDDLIESGRAGILETKFRFIELTLTQIGPEGEIKSEADTDRAAARRADDTALRALRTMTASTGETDARAFVIAIEERSRTASGAQSVVSRVYRWTDRLLRSALTKQRQFDGHDAAEIPEAVLIWAALLCTWEDRLLDRARRPSFRRRCHPDMQMVEWNRLCRDFLARSSRVRGDDPLVDCWARLRSCINIATNKDLSVLERSRLDMLLALQTCLAGGTGGDQHEWKTRLRSSLHSLPAQFDED